jgi:hypothetical protein
LLSTMPGLLRNAENLFKKFEVHKKINLRSLEFFT